MKGFLFVAIALACHAFSFAQNSKKVTFPDDFVGVWKGTLLWYRNGDTTARPTPMELYILPSKDTAGQYSWHLIYGSANTDSRPYKLMPADSAKIHWVIDELNGIKLDQYWIGNRFCGSFTVQNSTITNCYYLEDGNLIAEFVAWPARPIARTGMGNEESPFVDSYGIKSFQRAVLKKQ